MNDTLSTNNILVIGGQGFIGSRLCPILRELGHNVTIFDKQPAPSALTSGEYVQADIRNLDQLCTAMVGKELVVNLAAEHQDNVRPLSLYTEVNVEGARNVCQAAESAGVKRIVFTSSVAVYGSHPVAMAEDTPHKYFNEYGRTKHLAEEEYVAWLNASRNHQLTIVRPTVVFGPGNRGNVYNFLRQMKYGPFVMFGDGLNIKSMAYVDNIAAFLAFLTTRSERYAVYNYADKPDFNVRELVTFVDQTLGRSDRNRVALPKTIGLLAGKLADCLAWGINTPLPISEIRVQKFCAPSQVDAERAFATGFYPAVQLRDGLAGMVRDHV